MDSVWRRFGRLSPYHVKQRPRRRRALSSGLVRGWLRVAVYGLAVVAFFEASARLALRNDRFFRRVAGEDDASWRLRWVKRHAKRPGIYFDFDAFSPTRGWALRPGIRDLRVFHGSTLNSNSHGLRGRDEFEYAKPPETTRIVVLGDSFTFGEEVSDDETYSRQLARRLPGVEVLNLGVHGYGHDQMLIYFLEEGLKYHPDVVLLGFVSDDMERNLLQFRDYAKPRYVLERGRLALRGSPVPTPDVSYDREWSRLRFFDLLTMLRERYRLSSGARQQEMRRLTLALLDALRDAIVAAGARPAFAYLPIFGEVTRTDPGMTERERFFFSYCRERGIQSIYLSPFFQKRLREGADLSPYGHWRALEHATAAEGIRAYLLEKGLLPGVNSH